MLACLIVRQFHTSFVPLYLLHSTFYAIRCVILIVYILNYRRLKIIKNYYHENMWLDDSNKILLDCIFSYTLATIYKISLNDVVSIIIMNNVNKLKVLLDLLNLVMTEKSYKGREEEKRAGRFSGPVTIMGLNTWKKVNASL